jgi:hypothetical protein
LLQGGRGQHALLDSCASLRLNRLKPQPLPRVACVGRQRTLKETNVESLMPDPEGVRVLSAAVNSTLADVNPWIYLEAGHHWTWCVWPPPPPTYSFGGAKLHTLLPCTHECWRVVFPAHWCGGLPRTHTGRTRAPSFIALPRPWAWDAHPHTHTSCLLFCQRSSNSCVPHCLLRRYNQMGALCS